MAVVVKKGALAEKALDSKSSSRCRDIIIKILVPLLTYLLGFCSASQSLTAYPMYIYRIKDALRNTVKPSNINSFSMEIGGLPFPRDPLPDYYCRQLDDWAVAIVSDINPKYIAHTQSIINGWGQSFPNKRIYVIGEVNKSSVPDPELRAITRDGYADVDLDQLSLSVSRGHQNHSPGWKRAQHLFLSAMKGLMAEFPTARYYLLVDADTTVRPHCLRSLMDNFAYSQYPLAFGEMKIQPSTGIMTLMGGSGNIWNQAAAKAIDIDFCLRETGTKEGSLQGHNSDRRIPLCFKHFNVTIVPTLGMHQLGLDGVAKAVSRNIWYPNFDAHQCTISVHRVDPATSKQMYDDDQAMLGCTSATAEERKFHS